MCSDGVDIYASSQCGSEETEVICESNSKYCYECSNGDYPTENMLTDNPDLFWASEILESDEQTYPVDIILNLRNYSKILLPVTVLVPEVPDPRPEFQSRIHKKEKIINYLDFILNSGMDLFLKKSKYLK